MRYIFYEFFYCFNHFISPQHLLIYLLLLNLENLGEICMSDKIEKPKFDISKLKSVDVSEIPPKAFRGKWMDWVPVLQNLTKNPTKALTLTEKEASLQSVKTQIAKAVKYANIEGIIINTRNINKTQTLFISYKKPIVKK